MSEIDLSKYITGDEAVANIAKSVRSLKSGVTALAKSMESDGKLITATLEAIKTAAREIGQKLPQLNFAKESDTKALTELLKQLDTYKRSAADLEKAEQGRAKVVRDTTVASQGLTTALKEQQEAFKKAYAANNVEGARQAAAEIILLKAKTDELNKAVRGVNTVLSASNGSFNNLKAETAKLRQELNGLEGGMGATSERAEALKKQISENVTRMRAFEKSTGTAYLSVGQYAQGIIEAVTALEGERKALLANAAALKMQAAATGLSADQQQKIQAEIKETDAQLTRVNKSLGAYGVQVGEAGSKGGGLFQNLVGQAASLGAAYLSLQALASGVQQVFDANVAYSDQAIAVRKTTSLTAQEFDNLADSLKQLDTRTSLAGLLDIAKVGGQLGIAKGDILEFTSAIDIAVQALGDDFGGSAETIATSLGKINTVFGKELGPDVAANILAIGSAINEIGAEGAATAPFLADVAQRVGAVAAQTKVGLNNVLAYSAVLEETGFSAERSGTSLNRLFSTISTKTDAAFKIAKFADSNLTLKEFTRLVNTDFNQAIQLFLKGLNAGGKTTTDLNKLLGTLKLQSGEAKNVIVTLAQNTELFAQRQATANDQLARATSLAEEASLANSNLAGKWERLKNSISAAVTDSGMTAFFERIIDGANAALSPTEKLIDKFQQQVQKTTDVALANQKLVSSAGTLLVRYQQLASTSKRTTDQNNELNTIILKLSDTYGESVVSINKETGAREINMKAVARAITGNKALYENSARTLAKRLADIDKQITAEKALNDVLFGAAQTSGKQVAMDLPEGQLEKIQRYINFLTIANDLNKGLPKQDQQRLPSIPEGVTKEQIDLVRSYTEQQRRLATSEDNLTKLQGNRQLVLQALGQLGLDATKATNLLTDATTKNTKGTGDSTLADEKKKKSTADLVAEQYKLTKARLEARAVDLERQADNPANTEEIRSRAQQKAAQVRIQLAKLEQVEELRLVVESNKDKLNGEAATNVARVRLTEKLGQDIKAINQKLSREEIALRNATLDALAEVDKVLIEGELMALDKVIANENASYQERQQAAYDAMARRIELIQIESETKRRAAKGDLLALQKINAEERKLTEQALTTAKPFDSQKYSQELEKGYALDALTLENLHAKKLISEKDYLRQVRALENEQEAETIKALEREYGETAEVLRRKAALRKKLNEQELDDDRQTYQRRVELLTQSLETVDTIGNAYFQIQSERNQRAQQQSQAEYDADVKKAGDNALLKTQAEERYRKRQNELARKQFKYDQQAALFQIALNLAIGTIKAAASAPFPLNLPAIAFIAAEALAAGAIVASRQPPIPQYFKGRAGGPAEWAWVGDRGAELVEDKSGGMQLVEKPTIVYLPAGATVHTAEKTTQILRSTEILQAARHVDMSPFTASTSFNASYAALQRVNPLDTLSKDELAKLLLQASLAGAQKVVQAIKNQRITTWDITPQGVVEITKQAGSLTREMKGRLAKYGLQ